MKVNFITKKIGVDSGIIVITDRNRRKLKYKDIQESLIIPNGIYNIYWKIDNTWNGPIHGNDKLKIDSKEMIISDPCYLKGDFPNQKSWNQFLKNTDYLRNPPENWIVIDKMGGDGEYNIEIDLESE